MAVRIATDPSTLLLAAQAQVQATLGPSAPAGVNLAAERVFLTLADDDYWESFPPDDVFVTLAISKANVDLPAFAGGGNLDLTFDGALALGIWSRLQVDLAGQDFSYLTDVTLGVFTIWHALLKGFSEWEATDASGNLLLEEPLRPLGFETRPRRKGDWGKLSSYWGIKWQQSLS